MAAVLAGWAADILPGWLVGGLLIREILMAAMAVWLLLRYRQTIAVRSLGKLATLLLYGSIPAYYLAAAEIAPGFFSGFGLICGVLGLAFYWAVVVAYVPDIRQAAVKSLSSETTNDGGVT